MRPVWVLWVAMRSSPRCRSATAPARLSGLVTVAKSLPAFYGCGGGLVGQAQHHDAGMTAGWVGADVTRAPS